jgi:hypothetical protein
MRSFLRIRSWLLIVGIASQLAFRGFQSQAAEAESARLFDSQIAPLLARHCFECHDTTSRKGKLDLSRKDSAMGDRKGGRAIIPGNSAESLLWKSIASDEMPEDRPPLTSEEKRLVREWIDSGAVWTADAIDPLAHTRDGRAAYNWIRRLTMPEYIETVRSAVGVEIGEEARRILPPDVRADGFHNTAYNLGADLHHVEAYASLAGVIVQRMDVPAFAARFTACKNLDDTCLREVIAGTGKWLLRGPLDRHEIDSFLDIARAVAREGGNFDEAVSYIVEAMLQSPRFIYRMENQQGDGNPRPVAPYELASRLSYILWGGPPDEELMNAAESDQLANKAMVQAQVNRMLKDQRAITRSFRFIYEWLDLDRLNSLRPDPERFPTWSDVLAGDMRDETLAFFEEVAWKQKRPLSDLLNAQVTFATPRLSDFYGLRQKRAPADSESPPERATKDLQVLYTFEEGGGDMVRDLSGAGKPIHLRIENLSAVRWGNGHLTLNSATLIESVAPPKRLIDRIKKSKAMTLEAWVASADPRQSGPARIVTLSSGSSKRNFTLGQDGNKFDVRLRTGATDGNGLPGLASPAGAVERRLTHVVYTRDPAGKATLYINGAEKISREMPGELSNWDQNFQLAIGNETSGDRLWRGTFHLLAIYSRALSLQEVRQNQAAGPRKEQTPALAGASSGENGLKALQVLYKFDEGGGDVVHDASGQQEPLNLKIEDTSAVNWTRAGLAVQESAAIVHPGSAARLVKALKKSKSVSLEAWITPANSSQIGPARILTLSSGFSQRNFTLGQDGDKYDVRLRAANSDANGLPSLSSPSGSLEPRLTHLVYTRDAKGKDRLYINGEEREARDMSGDLSNWDEDFKLVLANETSMDRPWKGTLHLLAIYDRALAPEEIRSTGQGLARYDLASVPSRGGLLTQGGALTIGGEEASMVARGLFVLHDFLYSAVGNPPPCADTTPVPSKPGLTQRAVAQTRIDNKSCGGCHSKFEPLAFGLEKFDGLGAFHEMDEFGNKLREDGEILFPGEEKPVSYESTAELMDFLAESPRVRKNITRKLTQFALGRPLVESDAPAVDKIHESAQKGGGTYASLITAIVTSDLVRMTQTETKN